MVSTSNLHALARSIQGVPVHACVPGSASALAGVRFGDIIIACNGTPTPSLEHYLEARRLDRQHMSLRVFRNGEEIDFKLTLHDDLDERVVQKFFEENSLVGMRVESSTSGPTNGDAC